MVPLVERLRRVKSPAVGKSVSDRRTTSSKVASTSLEVVAPWRPTHAAIASRRTATACNTKSRFCTEDISHVLCDVSSKTPSALKISNGRRHGLSEVLGKGVEHYTNRWGLDED